MKYQRVHFFNMNIPHNPKCSKDYGKPSQRFLLWLLKKLAKNLAKTTYGLNNLGRKPTALVGKIISYKFPKIDIEETACFNVILYFSRSLFELGNFTVWNLGIFITWISQTLLM